MLSPISSVRIVVADDHPLLREGVKTALSRQSDFSVVGEAATGDEAIEVVARQRPDILLLDVRMPGPPADVVVLAARAAQPGLRILVLTAYDDEVMVRRMSQTPISGYILKDEATDSLAQAIRVIHSGSVWFSRAVGSKVMSFSRPEIDPLLGFTVRELGVLRLIGRGWENEMVASDLNLARQTVRNYIRALYTKMDVHSRGEAVVWAREHGLK